MKILVEQTTFKTMGDAAEFLDLPISTLSNCLSKSNPCKIKGFTVQYGQHPIKKTGRIVTCEETGEKFQSIRELANKYNINSITLTSRFMTSPTVVLDGKTYTAEPNHKRKAPRKRLVKPSPTGFEPSHEKTQLHLLESLERFKERKVEQIKTSALATVQKPLPMEEGLKRYIMESLESGNYTLAKTLAEALEKTKETK